MPQTFLVAFHGKCKQGKRDRDQKKRLELHFLDQRHLELEFLSATFDYENIFQYLSTSQSKFTCFFTGWSPQKIKILLFIKCFFLYFVFVTARQGGLTFSNEKLESCED